MIDKNILMKEMTAAMKSGDTIRVNVLRFFLAHLKNFEIEKRAKSMEPELTQEEVLRVLRRLVGQERESIEFLRNAGRTDSVKEEEHKLGILESYLPQQMSEAEARELVKAIVGQEKASSMKDFGMIMKKLIERAEGRAEGTVLSKILKTELESV